MKKIRALLMFNEYAHKTEDFIPIECYGFYDEDHIAELFKKIYQKHDFILFFENGKVYDNIIDNLNEEEGKILGNEWRESPFYSEFDEIFDESKNYFEAAIKIHKYFDRNKYCVWKKNNKFTVSGCGILALSDPISFNYCPFCGKVMMIEGK